MRKIEFLGASLCAVVGLATGACSSSSPAAATDAGQTDTGAHQDAGKPATDAGKPTTDAGKPKADAPNNVVDASPPKTDSGKPVGAHVLVTYNGTANKAAPSTMIAVNLTTKAIDGQIHLADSQAITDTLNPARPPFLLEQSLDVLVGIDPASWTVDGTWSIPAPPSDSGATADPYAVSVATESQVYVLSFASNDIAVFNTTTAADGGAPTSVIHLASLLQPGDMDGFVDATAGAYDATSKLLYVVLGNVNNAATTLDYMGNYDTICSTTTSSVIAIDTTTNTIVSLGGTAPGGGIALKLYDPSGPSGFAYDAANARLLVFEAGCNPAPPPGDGGAPGAIKLRGVEAVDLKAKTSTILLDASTQGFPGGLEYIDSTHAVLGFIYPTPGTYLWDPTSATIGAALPNAPSPFAYDGNGNLVGASVVYGDSGTATTNIVSMALATGDVTTLQTNVIDIGMGYVGSVGVWPHP